MGDGLVRHLDRIQEAEGPVGASRLGTVVMVAISCGCIAFAAVSHYRVQPASESRKSDPLSELAARSAVAAPPSEFSGKDVTFPHMLSDNSKTTTALAAMRDEHLAPTTPDSRPPPAADRLSVVSLPAKNIVAASPLLTHPRDTLTQMAKDASSPTGALADEGRPGGYQLQASSYRNETEATAFATALRQRGHRAYVEPAAVAGRGTWYRVRVGPFRSQLEAAQYRAEFERREHLVPFLVEPPREKPAARRPDSESERPTSVRRRSADAE